MTGAKIPRSFIFKIDILFVFLVFFLWGVFFISFFFLCVMLWGICIVFLSIVYFLGCVWGFWVPFQYGFSLLFGGFTRFRTQMFAKYIDEFKIKITILSVSFNICRFYC